MRRVSSCMRSCEHVRTRMSSFASAIAWRRGGASLSISACLSFNRATASIMRARSRSNSASFMRRRSSCRSSFLRASAIRDASRSSSLAVLAATLASSLDPFATSASSLSRSRSEPDDMELVSSSLPRSSSPGSSRGVDPGNSPAALLISRSSLSRRSLCFPIAPDVVRHGVGDTRVRRWVNRGRRAPRFKPKLRF